jgi:hypothetical protein
MEMPYSQRRWVKATNLRVVRMRRRGWPSQGGGGVPSLLVLLFWLLLGLLWLLLLGFGFGFGFGGVVEEGGGGGRRDGGCGGGGGWVGLGENLSLVGLRRLRRMGVVEGMNEIYLECPRLAVHGDGGELMDETES